MVVDTETLWAKGKVADYGHYSTFEGREEGELRRDVNRAEKLDSNVVGVKEWYSSIALL